MGKIGDATKEVYRCNFSLGWFDDYANIVTSIAPFFRRGGTFSEAGNAGIFNYTSANHGAFTNLTFRAALCP